MKFAPLFAVSLLPVGLMAAPAADADLIPKDVLNNVEERATTTCAITGSSVNCRTGPGTSYGVVATLAKGTVGIFTCVKSGQCITVSGSVNWYVRPGCWLSLWERSIDISSGWDRMMYFGTPCYVNGHYTDSSCTQGMFSPAGVLSQP